MNLTDKINEDMHEYDSLRNEILSMQERQRNVWINMYVIFGTLFVLGLEWSYYLFLVTYIILIPFQCVINDFLWSISKISTYIRIFYENERSDMNWEGLHLYDGYEEYYRKKSSGLDGLTRNFGSAHLGLIATGFFCGCSLIEKWDNGMFLMTGSDILFILFSWILFWIIVAVNCNYRKNNHHELEKIISEYKQKIVEKKANS